MVAGLKISSAAIKAFNQTYDTTHENIAIQVRGEFLQAFPLSSFRNIKLNDYVIGLQKPTFCTYVEVRTRAWASIQGATARKFGIYFGRTKTDPSKKYRYPPRFGETQGKAFSAVKKALQDIVILGAEKNLDFTAIDVNPLSQMFKAKILSLYFPDRFLNVCSENRLVELGVQLGYGKGRPISEYQHLLLKAKLLNASTRVWSNPKFTAFPFSNFVCGNRKPVSGVQKPHKKSHKKVNFEDIQLQRSKIGEAAEVYALEWEKQRLVGAGLCEFVSAINDRRDRPGFGYDFLSHTSPKKHRFFEVKSVGKVSGGEGFRFFLSDNEKSVSESVGHRDEYFFYLVFFDGNRKPVALHPIRADKLYQLSEILSASYVVRFDFDA